MSVNVVVIGGAQGAPGPSISIVGLSILTVANSGLTLTSGVFYPVDTSGGVVTLQAPTAVEPGLFGVSDIFGKSSVNPIVINAVGAGVTIGDPSNAGSFSTSVHIASPAAPTVWWVFIAAASKWVPIWW